MLKKYFYCSVSLLILVFYTFPLKVVHSLDLNERQDIIVTKINNDSVITINRGIEDGVNKWEHIKIFDKVGYVARGVCLKSSMSQSYWLAYHVVATKRLAVNKHMYYKKIDLRLMPKIVYQHAREVNIDRVIRPEGPRYEPLARDDARDVIYEGVRIEGESLGLYGELPRGTPAKK